MSTAERGNRLVAQRYRLDQLIGRGAMGAVWEAEDTVLGRAVAVKEVVLPPGLSHEDRAIACERALREARAIARLAHPNVVMIYDMLDEDQRPWVVMELIRARSLAQILKEDGPLDPLRAASVGLAVLGALSAAHEAGITHRDVKPGNILLSVDGRVKLTDFGIARAAGDMTLTGTGLLVGSPSYMAPEVVRGQEIGPAADLFGLGATLYCAVEGKPPFGKGDAMATLSAVVSEPPARYRSAGPLRPVLDGLLEKDPTRRLSAAGAGAMLSDLVAEPEEPEPGPDASPLAILRPRADLEPAPEPGSRLPVPVTGPRWVEPDPNARTEVNLDQQPPAPFGYPGQPQPGQGGPPPGYPHPGFGPPVPGPPGQGFGPPPGYDPYGRPRRIRDPRKVAVLGGACALIVIVIIVLVVTLGGGGGTGSGDGGGDGGRPIAGGDDPTNGADDEVQPGSVPVGYTEYSDPAGFTVAVPDGWARSNDGNAIDFEDDANDRFLRFYVLPVPSTGPEGGFGEQGFAAAHPDYRRLRLEPIEYRDYDAVEWEFTYTSDSGPRHVLWRGFVVGDQLFGIYLSAPEAGFADAKQYFDNAADTFAEA